MLSFPCNKATNRGSQSYPDSESVGSKVGAINRTRPMVGSSTMRRAKASTPSYADRTPLSASIARKPTWSYTARTKVSRSEKCS
ncbi:Uncharacterised protein [Mycobacteroides abscessus subsp. abscessus]|nr:Uncharacterised protein [Mycobacteroides abscessus subsp. abscessus]